MDHNVRVGVGANVLIGLGCVLAAASRGDAKANAGRPVIVRDADKPNGIVRTAAIYGGIAELEIGVRDGLASQTDLRREDWGVVALCNIAKLKDRDCDFSLPRRS